MKRFNIKRKQIGAAAIEFALIASIFFTILIGILEMGRVLFYMNSAAEATRLGARIAVVCNKDEAALKAIKTNMKKRLSILADNNINVNYEPAPCTQATCNTINVAITGVSVTTFIPLIPDSIKTFNLPNFSTTLPRESMDSTDNSSLCI